MTVNTASIQPVVSPIPEGYRIVPGVPQAAVNEKGEVWNVKLGRPAKIQTSGGVKSNSSGYKFISFAIGDGKTSTKYLHRMVAMAFIPVPAELLEYIDVLHVNHKDGNKANNAVSNLEWVTPAGNIQHVLETGLKTFNKVLARNLLTDEVREFLSAEHVAREFNISIKRLRRHLDSEFAGYHSKDYWVFKYKNNGKPWPEVTDELIVPDRWDRNYGVWTATNIKDSSIPVVMAGRLEDLCEGIRLKYYSVQPEVRADGAEWVVMGWRFVYYSIPTKAMLDAVEYKDKSKFRPKRSLKISFPGTQQASITIGSLRAGAKLVGIAMNTISYAIAKRNGYHKAIINGISKTFHFEYVE